MKALMFVWFILGRIVLLMLTPVIVATCVGAVLVGWACDLVGEIWESAR